MKNSISNLNATARGDDFRIVDLPSYEAETARTSFRPHEVPRPVLAAPADRLSKRAFDVAASIALIVLFGPLLLLIALAVRCDGGPALFGHRRIGAAGTSFRCWKFRSMVLDSETVLARTLATDPMARAEWDKDFKLRKDPRVTPLGAFLRKSSLDELPQLFNVLKGEMSLVGPRPIVAAEVERYGQAMEEYRACKPGITGLWQVSGRNDVDYAERVELDRRYAWNWSLKGDLMILFRTLGVVVRRSGAY
jgi:undecaprenyl-phosphate galactose phosphotransferase